jgi:hypothetical protein
VRADVNLGVSPVDEFAVHPDLREFLHGASPLGRLGRGTEFYPGNPT